MLNQVATTQGGGHISKRKELPKQTNVTCQNDKTKPNMLVHMLFEIKWIEINGIKRTNGGGN